MKILAIETSCDETAIAIIEITGPKKRPVLHMLSHIVSSQAKLHAKFGGVVPNLANREHQKNLVPLLLEALKESKLLQKVSRETKNNKILNTKYLLLNTVLEREPELLKQFKKHVAPLQTPPVDTIAVTYGPGLAPALWVGVNFAKALAYLWKKSLIPVNHMEGHIFSAITNVPLTQRSPHKWNIRKIRFPALALLVSGGHTELVIMPKYGTYKLIGETRDDAAGEAFDKVARILELPYPGGPEISRFAEKGDSKKYQFPRPMINTKDYNFSFSGLKTAVFYTVRGFASSEEAKPRRLPKKDIAASFQKAVVDVLIKKTIRAAKGYKVKTILLGGGVSANKKLREELIESIKNNKLKADCRMPEAALAGDNALMIAIAAYFTGKKKAWTNVQADANLQF